jgi:hypothetical protein
VTPAVNNHNRTIMAGWILTHLPLGELAFRANLTSVVLVRFDQTGDGRWLRLLFLLSGLAVFNHAQAYDEDRDLFVVTVDQPLGGMLEGLPVLSRATAARP